MEDEAPMEDAPEGAEAETSPAPDDAYDDVEPENPTAAEDEAPASTSLVFADLDAEAMGRLDALADDPAARVALLNEIMGVKHYDDNPRSAILVDFCMYNLVFCDEEGFSVEKKSALFSIMKRVFEHAFQGGSDGMDSGALVEGETVTREESMEFFQEQIMNHSVDAPERGMVGVFSLPEVEKLTNFVGKTFYRAYTAYKLCFSTRQPVEHTVRHIVVETPLTPPPLALFEPTGDTAVAAAKAANASSSSASLASASVASASASVASASSALAPPADGEGGGEAAEPPEDE